jgi:hypothetical protein
VSLIGRGVDPTVPQRAVGPIDLRTGVPSTFTDENNVTLGRSRRR